MCIWWLWLRYLVFWLSYLMYLGMLLEKFSIDNIGNFSFCFFVYLSSGPRRFLAIKGRRPQLHASHVAAIFIEGGGIFIYKKHDTLSTQSDKNYVSVCLSVFLSICPSVYMCVCTYVHLYICLSVSLSCRLRHFLVIKSRGL